MLNKKTISVAIVHLILAGTLFSILYYLNIVTTIPTESNVLNWDAEWFNSIRANGYEFKANQICNLAFFPLFPYFWKWTFLGGVHISIINCLIFIIALAYLLKDQALSYMLQLYIFSTASFIFLALPYSESLFFLFATLIIRGYKTESAPMMVIGFFFASLVRSIAMIFIPAIIICAFFLSETKMKKSVIKISIYNILASLCGLLISAYIQYRQAGKWFYFLKVQKLWGREWHTPGFPLTSTYPERTMGIDSIAFIVGIFAICFCFKYALIFIKNHFTKDHIAFKIDVAVFFSIICLAGITILDTCFTFKIAGASNIWSINRHILCSPFYIVFLLWIYNTYNPGKGELRFILLLIITGIYFTGVYAYPNLALYYLMFFFALYVFKYCPSYQRYLILVYLFNTVTQILFYQDFLRNLWIG
jgi:hypothetical protein